ncbi:MAG TPA: hypothetical protein VNA86_06520, partial [bacterium]|nr:hypothetical protein [bacterium]
RQIRRHEGGGRSVQAKRSPVEADRPRRPDSALPGGILIRAGMPLSHALQLQQLAAGTQYVPPHQIAEEMQ